MSGPADDLRLDRLAALLKGMSPERRGAFLDDLDRQEPTMSDTTTKTVQLAIRLDEALVARLDEHAARLRAKTPGARVTRADAVRVALVAALDRAEAEAQDQER